MRNVKKNIPVGHYAILLGILYWPIETLIHLLFFNQGGFFELLFDVEANEAWMRLLVSLSFIAFGTYANRAIQHHQELNQQLQQQRNKLRRVIDSAHDAYVAIDAQSIITDWNPMAEKIFGWSRSEAIGMSLLDTIVPERFRQAHEHGMKVYLNDGSGLWLYRSITTTARHNDGSEFPIEMAIIPLRSGDEQSFYAFIRKANGAAHE